MYCKTNISIVELTVRNSAATMMKLNNRRPPCGGPATTVSKKHRTFTSSTHGNCVENPTGGPLSGPRPGRRNLHAQRFEQVRVVVGVVHRRRCRRVVRVVGVVDQRLRIVFGRIEIVQFDELGTVDRQLQVEDVVLLRVEGCLLYTSPSPRDRQKSRMPSSA